MTERNINIRPNINQIIATVTFQRLQRNLSNKRDLLDDSIDQMLSSNTELNIDTNNFQDIDKELYRIYKIKNKEALDQFYNLKLDESLIHFKEALKIMNQLKGKYIREINYTNYYIQKIHDLLKKQNHSSKYVKEHKEDCLPESQNESMNNLTNSYTFNYFKKRNYLGSLQTCKNGTNPKRNHLSMHNNSPINRNLNLNKHQFSVSRHRLNESNNSEKIDSDYSSLLNSSYVKIIPATNSYSNHNNQIRIPKQINRNSYIESAEIYFNKGLYYFDKGDFSNAIDSFRRSIDLYNSNSGGYDFDFNLGILYLNLGKAYSKLNFTGLAITNFMKSSEKFKNIGNKEMESEAIRELSLIH